MYQKRAYRRKIKKPRKSQKNKITKKDRIIALVSFVGIFVAATLLAYRMLFVGHSDAHNHKSDMVYEFVANEKVCMRNNSYRAEIIPSVSIKNKFYYGCCESCTDFLAKNPEERYALDPISGTKVDKALAFILHSTEEVISKVYYFNSKENAKVFANENNPI